MTSPSTPRAEYDRRLAARRQQVELLDRRESRAGLMRLLCFVAILLALGAAWRGALDGAMVLLSVAAFVAAVAWHRRVVAAGERARRAVEHYRRALARLDERWAGTGPDGLRYLDAAHPYAADLDLFGRGSLFQRLSLARTRMGEDTLAAWLLAPAPPAALRARQAAVDELREQLDLREALAVLDARLATQLEPEVLRRWAAAPRRLRGAAWPLAAAMLGAAALVALVGWGWLNWGLGPLALVALLEGLVLRAILRPMRELSEAIEGALVNLGLLGEVLRIVERQSFQSPLLREISAALADGGRLPSQRIARLARLVEAWETIRRNQFVAPIAFLLMLHVQVVHAIERWRGDSGRHIPAWLDAVGQFEALVSLAGYGYEYPERPWPDLAETGPLLEAEELGHPLLPASRCVRNDVRLADPLRLLLVSGSNMSGKSTLLRAVGCNVVLAQAGAPVFARRLRLSPLAVGTAMRVQDSLQEGQSKFFAEIKRLRAIVTLAETGDRPVLFLFDEILHGTNSHDRRIGAEGVVGKMLAREAIGLVTTHDLALAEIVARLAPAAANVHFEDQFVDGRMSFDYRLRPGVVPKSNALALMRLLGLEV